jgi:hypothetical protein
MLMLQYRQRPDVNFGEAWVLTAVSIQNDRIQLAKGELGPELIWQIPSSSYLPDTYGKFYVLSYFCGANQQNKAS